MSAKEYTAKSVEEALEKALNEMMLTREDIHYEIVQQPSKGFLGFGQKDAVVRVSKKDAAETKVEAVEVKAEIPVQEPTPVVEVVVDDTEEQEAEVSFEEAFDTDIDEETEELDVAVAKADKKELYEAAEAKGRAFLAKIFDEMKLDVVIDVKEKGVYLVFDIQDENLVILIVRRG